jgi:hypothetical protein
MHKASGVRDPAAAFPLPSVRDDAADRRAASRAVAVSAIGLAVIGVVELLRAVLTGQVTWPPSNVASHSPQLNELACGPTTTRQRMSVIEVAIGPDRVPGTFRVEVVSSPTGEAAAVTVLDTAALLARCEELQQSVPVSAVATRRVLPETEECVREVGETLFKALLGAGEVAGR